MFETLEERLILASSFFLVLFAGLYLYNRLRRSKRERKRSDSALLFLALITVFILFMQYASLRPYHPISIIVMVCTIFFMIGISAIFFLRPLRRVTIFDKNGKMKGLNLIIVIISYVFLFGLIWQGLGFLLGNVFKPESVVLTPEFTRYLIPTMAGILLIFYRLGTRINTPLLKTIADIFGTIILGSFASFAYTRAAGMVGVELFQPFTPQMSDFLVGGLLVAFAGIVLEIFTFHVTQKLQQIATHLRGKSVFDLISLDGLLSILEKGEKIEKREHAPRKKQVKKNFFTRHSKPITIVIIAAFIISLFLIWPNKVKVKILVPAFFVSTEIVGENNLPSDMEILMSDQLDGKNVTSFAIPLVNIHTGDYSYSAPNNTRYSAISSPGFEVTERQEYLVVNLDQTSVEVSLIVSRSASIDYDQRGNSQFNYVGFFRDAEIYYALHVFGYDNINTFSSSGLYGTMSSMSKVIYATAPDNRKVLVQISRTMSMFPIDDRIVITTPHFALLENMEFILKQMKLNITIESRLEEPEPPFRFV